MKRTFVHYPKLFLKGIAGIFAIKLTLLVVLLTMQACESDDSDDFTPDNRVQLEKFGKIALEVSQKLDLRFKGISKGRTNVAYPEITEEEAEEITTPLVSAGVDLIRSYGITDQEIVTEFGSLEHPDLANVGLAIYRVDLLAAEGYTFEDFDETDFEAISMLMGAQPAHAVKAFDCALDAVGVKVLMDLGEGGLKKLGKKGVLKLIKKVALRSLGFVGAAVAAYEFADCMGWLGGGTTGGQE